MPTTALDPTVVADLSGTGSVVARRYRLDGVIGEGAMGTVYRALDLQTGSTVAIKALHAHIAADTRLGARFEREIAAGRKLVHPNLVPVIDDGHALELGRYLVMPLLGGTDLRHEITGGVGLRRSLALVDQLLSALAHVHGVGLVHRDIKPENIRLVRDDAGDERLLLLDFGLVKPIGAKSSEPRLTENGRVFGTPWYMAPEQAMGARIDHRVDLYAVGALLFEMLSGAPPFEGSLVSVLNQQIMVPAPPLPSWVPPAIAKVVGQLLEKDANARPATAVATAAALRAAVAGVSAQPTRLSVGERFSIGDVIPSASPPVSMLRSSQRQARWIAATFATAAAIVGAFALSSYDGANEPSTQLVVAESVEAPKPNVITPAPVVAPASIVALVPSVAPVVVSPAAPTSAPKQVNKPSRPRAKPSVPRIPDKPAPPRSISAKKPPRAVSKLPGGSSAAATRGDDGRVHLRPRNS